MTASGVLVTGASGFIGAALVPRLQRAGCRVTALTRQTARRFPPGVSVKGGDLISGAGIDLGLLAGIDVIFHCAGELTRLELMRPLHVGGTARLLESARAQSGRGPLHWVQLSSVGAYGPAARAGHDRTVDESTPERPSGEYEVTKTESDGLVTQAARDGWISRSTLRPSNVIGADMPNNSLRQAIAMIGRRWFFHIGRAGAVANYVHVDDVSRALIECGRHPSARGATFNISSDCDWEALAAHIADTCGVRRPLVRLPESMVRAAAAIVGAVATSPLTASRIDALVSRTRYPMARIAETLDFSLARPMPAGVDDVIPGAR